MDVPRTVKKLEVIKVTVALIGSPYAVAAAPNGSSALPP
jgi:hypothetical protein